MGLLAIASRPAVGRTQLPILSSIEIKNAWNYTSTPPVRLVGVVLS
jgi:hypothetical protein